MIVGARTSVLPLILCSSTITLSSTQSLKVSTHFFVSATVQSSIGFSAQAMAERQHVLACALRACVCGGA
jgi:hypothetical protein